MRFFRRKSKKSDPDALERRKSELEALLAEAKIRKKELIDTAKLTGDVALDLQAKLSAQIIERDQEIETTAVLMSDALIVCDHLGQITKMNGRAEKILMVQFDAQIAQTLTDRIVEASDLPALVGNPHIVTIQRDDGSAIKVSINVAPMERVDGSTHYLVAISDEFDPRGGEAFPKMSLIAIGGVISSFSHEVSNTLGYDERIIGTPISSLFAESERPFVEQHLVRDRIETQFDSSILRQDGSLLYCQVSALFLDDEKSFVITIENTGNEVTARHYHPIKIFGNSYTLESANTTNQIHNAMIVLSPTLIVTYMNEAMREYFGIDDDPIGKHLSQFISADELKATELHFMSLSENDPERTIRLTFPRLNSRNSQEWTDRANYADGTVREYIRCGRLT